MCLIHKQRVACRMVSPLYRTPVDVTSLINVYATLTSFYTAGSLTKEDIH